MTTRHVKFTEDTRDPSVTHQCTCCGYRALQHPRARTMYRCVSCEKTVCMICIYKEICDKCREPTTNAVCADCGKRKDVIYMLEIKKRSFSCCKKTTNIIERMFNEIKL